MQAKCRMFEVVLFAKCESYCDTHLFSMAQKERERRKKGRKKEVKLSL
jgi:hypothetical protein